MAAGENLHVLVIIWDMPWHVSLHGDMRIKSADTAQEKCSY
jgi:hypothetical protein